MVPLAKPISVSFWLLSLCFVALAGVHHLSYQQLISLQATSNLPRRLNVHKTNDLVLWVYDSRSGKLSARNGYTPSDQESWQFWRAGRAHCQNWESWVETEYQALVQEVNTSSPKAEPYYLQILKTCELDDTTGTIQATTRYALNGEDMLQHQSDQKRWFSVHPVAWHVAERWNRQGETSLSHITPQRCRLWIERNTPFVVQKTAQPAAHVALVPGTQDQPPRLVCQVTGFYPRDIEVTWERGGQVAQGEQVTSGIHPNGDPTFQVEVSIEVGQEGVRPTEHVCVVRHSSLGDAPLRVTWVAQTTDSVGVLLIIVACILSVLGALALGLVPVEEEESRPEGAVSRNADTARNP